MAGMKGINCFLIARYIVFGLFTICNAITCSVAVWNSSLVRSTQLFQVDIYLIFLGAFSLVSIFTLVFVELLCVHAVTTRVWFECGWITLFWVMELAGGAALIAIESDIPCSHQQATMILDALCTSDRVLLAFTWICTIILLIYLLALVFIVTSQHPKVPKIWDSDVRALCATTLRHCCSSTSNSPLTTRFKRRASVDIYSPQPVRSQPVHLPYHRRGLSAEYEIEPFPPAFVGGGPEQMDVPHPSNLPEAIPLPPLAAAPTVPSFMRPIPTLPKDTLLLRQSNPPQELASSIIYSGSVSPLPGPVPTVPSQSNSLPSPSPLGNWPRQDIMQLPVKPKPRRKSPPPSSFEFPNRHDRASVPADMVTQPRPRRPSGPRLRVPSLESGHRLAPLDLSGISNYETGRRDS